MYIVVLAAAAAAALAHRQDSPAPEGTLVYIGTYTRSGSEGIYAFRFDAGTGTLRPIGLAAATNPSFLAVHPNGRWLYAVNEDDSFQGEKSGAPGDRC